YLLLQHLRQPYSIRPDRPKEECAHKVWNPEYSVARVLGTQMHIVDSTCTMGIPVGDLKGSALNLKAKECVNEGFD
ncbi:hypothetical protein Tco_0253859, partial [Tanacetum coccineum]